MSEIGEVSWNDRLEEYFASTGERAHCLSWIHKRAEELYSKRRTFIDLPVIVISSVVGFLSVGSSQMFANREMESSVALGIASLAVSVLNTIGTYFGWAKRAEGHRITSIQYAKLYRFLSIEMSLPREERMSPSDLLKYAKESYDRLQEISPLIPPEVIKEFQKKFGDEKEIAKPEEANGLEKIVVFQNPTPPLKIRVPPSVAGGLDSLVKSPAVLPPIPLTRQTAIGTGLVPRTHLSQHTKEEATSHEQVGLTIVPTKESVENRTNDSE